MGRTPSAPLQLASCGGTEHARIHNVANSATSAIKDPKGNTANFRLSAEVDGRRLEVLYTLAWSEVSATH